MKDFVLKPNFSHVLFASSLKRSPRFSGRLQNALISFAKPAYCLPETFPYVGSDVTASEAKKELAQDLASCLNAEDTDMGTISAMKDALKIFKSDSPPRLFR